MLMSAVIALLAALMVQAMRIAMAILENIDIQAAPVDVSVITDAARQATTASSTLLSFLLLLCWLGAAVDAYLLGKKLDRKEKLPSETA